MSKQRLNRMPAVCTLGLCAALLASCGGGEGVAPDKTAAQSERAQAALNRAMQANANALSTVKGERGVSVAPSGSR
jgi:hypothetical protein